MVSTNELTYSKEQALVYALSHKQSLTSLLQEDIWSTVYDINGEKYSYEDLFTTDMKEFITEVYILSKIARSEDINLDETKLANIDQASKEYFDLLKTSKLKIFSNINSKEDIYNIFLDYALVLELKKALLASDEFELSESEARVIEVEEYSFTDEEVLEQIKEDLANNVDLSTKIATYGLDTNIKKISKNEALSAVEKSLFDLENEVYTNVEKDSNKYYFYKILNSYDIDATKINKENLRIAKLNEYLEKEYDEYIKENKLVFPDKLYTGLREYIKLDLDIKSFFEFYEEKLSESN